MLGQGENFHGENLFSQKEYFTNGNDYDLIKKKLNDNLIQQSSYVNRYLKRENYFSKGNNDISNFMRNKDLNKRRFEEKERPKTSERKINLQSLEEQIIKPKKNNFSYITTIIQEQEKEKNKKNNTLSYRPYYDYYSSIDPFWNKRKIEAQSKIDYVKNKLIEKEKEKEMEKERKEKLNFEKKKNKKQKMNKNKKITNNSQDIYQKNNSFNENTTYLNLYKTNKNSQNISKEKKSNKNKNSLTQMNTPKSKIEQKYQNKIDLKEYNINNSLDKNKNYNIKCLTSLNKKNNKKKIANTSFEKNINNEKISSDKKRNLTNYNDFDNNIINTSFKNIKTNLNSNSKNKKYLPPKNKNINYNNNIELKEIRKQLCDYYDNKKINTEHTLTDIQKQNLNKNNYTFQSQLTTQSQTEQSEINSNNSNRINCVSQRENNKLNFHKEIQFSKLYNKLKCPSNDIKKYKFGSQIPFDNLPRYNFNFDISDMINQNKKNLKYDNNDEQYEYNFDIRVNNKNITKNKNNIKYNYKSKK